MHTQKWKPLFSKYKKFIYIVKGETYLGIIQVNFQLNAMQETFGPFFWTSFITSEYQHNQTIGVLLATSM